MTDQDNDSAINESLSRKSHGAAIVTLACFYAFVSAPLLWWQALIVAAAIWVGLHMVAGLNIKWHY